MVVFVGTWYVSGRVRPCVAYTVVGMPRYERTHAAPYGPKSSRTPPPRSALFSIDQNARLPAVRRAEVACDALVAADVLLAGAPPGPPCPLTVCTRQTEPTAPRRTRSSAVWLAGHHGGCELITT